MCYLHSTVKYPSITYNKFITPSQYRWCQKTTFIHNLWQYYTFQNTAIYVIRSPRWSEGSKD